MASNGRKIGVNIHALMQKANVSREYLAEQLGYTCRDVSRLLEGRLWLPPIELSRVAEQLGVTKEDLLNFESDNLVPELQYMKEFDDPDNLEKVLDLLDEYVELKEAL